MKQVIVMPQMGESITNGTITKWHKRPGDHIDLDEIFFEISTDKVESEIPSPFSGRVESLFGEEGDTIDVGLKIAIIEDDPAGVPMEKNNTRDSEQAAAPISKKIVEKKQEDENLSVENTFHPNEKVMAVSSAGHREERNFYTPLVKAMAKKAGIPLTELGNIPGTGAGGRVNKSDFKKFLDSRASMKNSVSKKDEMQSTAKSPLVLGERVDIIPMDNMRKAIAKNMVTSKLTAPHVNSLDEIDMTHLVKFREGFKQEFMAQEGISLTYTHFILYAIVQALKEWPLINASLDGDNIVLKKDINLGCAVSVPGNGLVVPVIKNCDGLTITGIARNVHDLAQRARSKKLTMDELTGGTFTFTNVGSFGTLMATPVILQPQSGIFATGVIKKRPVITSDDAIGIRSMMYGTHTYDHRIVDGELGGRFLNSVKHHLEKMMPEALF